MAEIIYLKHKSWKEAKPFNKTQALKMLKNQKHPNVPHHMRNDWELVSDEGEKEKAPEPESKEQSNQTDVKKGTKRGANKKATRKASS